MNERLVNRLISLVKKTGHPAVFGNPETGEGVVLMDLAEYEQLVDGQATQPTATVAAQSQPPIQQQPRQNFPSKDTRREHRINETLAEVLEQPTAPPEPPAPEPVKKTEQNTGTDLTAAEQEANINREITSQPTRPNNRPTDRNPSAKKSTQPANQTPVHQPQPEANPDSTPAGSLDEEERFYLEPLE